MSRPPYQPASAAMPGRSGAGGAPDAVEGGKPGDPDFARMIRRPHPTWYHSDLRWRWLLDSYIGGRTYTNAVYSVERNGLPVRNLIRHNSEYPDPEKNPNSGYYGATPGLSPASMLGGAEYAVGLGGFGMMGPWPGMMGADPAATAHDDTYELRRARTPVPPFVEEAVGVHLSKIYDQEIRRDGPDDLKAWWQDVDGRGTPIDDWMRETVAPLLLVLGVLDVCLDHPQAPPGEAVATRADELRLKLDSCVASYILPTNMIWWKLDGGHYQSCLVREFVDPSDRDDSALDGSKPMRPDERRKAVEGWRKNYVRYRYWDAAGSVLLNHDGSEVISRTPHRFGQVPIVRLTDVANPHQPHAGKSRYESTAAYQREYYNRDSELILNDILQAHPLLSGPAIYAKGDETVSVGPNNMLPMARDSESGRYQGWEFVSPPKDPAESIRRNKQDIRDAVDRINCLVKPAGSASGGGTGHSTVSQSGLSKGMDHHHGNKLLRGIVKTLAKAERVLAEMACMVIRNAPLPRIRDAVRDAVKVVYPARFALQPLSEMTADAVQMQAILAAAGHAPMTETALLQAMVRQALPDLDDERYEELDEELRLTVEAQATVKSQMREAAIEGISDATNVEGPGSSEQGAEGDPLGQSARTAVSGLSQYSM